MKTNMKFGIGVILAAMLLVSMAFVPAVSATPEENMSKLPALQFNDSSEKKIINAELSTMKGDNLHSIPIGSIIHHSADGITTVFTSDGKQYLSAVDAKAKMIATPSGLKPATRIHQVPSGSDIRTNENITNIYYNGTCIMSIVNEDYADNLEKIDEVPDFKGWLKSTVDKDVAGVRRFVAYWNVPTTPPHPNNDAVDFLFNAIKPNGESGIMQPVLEWNQLQSGRWTGAAWYGINDVYYHSARINVDQGDKIEGLLSWDNTYSRWLIAFEDVTAGHQVYFHTNDFDNTHLDVYTALEGSHVVDNGDVPGDTLFYDMEFKDLNLNTFNVIWGEVNYAGIPVGITNLDANIISSSKVELLTAND
ncbi:hypothetical protein SAMN04488587_0580 [Methanococcoides vulcani]|uniref:Uncharacterized protein n=1 Tax=Methanococcoides vulcani TaxID=1353158 RepID=A0A1H9YJG8_9EURY|nr:hypothetical protein [Methanococcoides vulcani]SES68647.1 hypothetical protein SAMN04488587_0580 [Methanococcoides vulcani]